MEMREREPVNLSAGQLFVLPKRPASWRCAKIDPMTSPTVVATRELELREILRSAWPDATVEPSALEVLPRINLDALRAVAKTAWTVAGLPSVTRVVGWRSREDPEWIQLVLILGVRPYPGSDEWHELMNLIADASEAAMRFDAGLIDAIASQISFDF